MLFLLFYLPLSLWDVQPLIPAVISLISLAGQVISAPVFLICSGPNGRDVRQIKKNHPRKNRWCLQYKNHPDPVPLILSYKGFFQKGIMGISESLPDLLSDEEISSLVNREIRLLSRRDAGFFTAAFVIPFVLYSAVCWFFESWRGGETPVHRLREAFPTLFQGC